MRYQTHSDAVAAIRSRGIDVDDVHVRPDQETIKRKVSLTDFFLGFTVFDQETRTCILRDDKEITPEVARGLLPEVEMIQSSNFDPAEVTGLTVGRDDFAEIARHLATAAGLPAVESS